MSAQYSSWDTLQYTREELLGMYGVAEGCPAPELPELIQSEYQEQPSLINLPRFEHTLGNLVNSRRPTKQKTWPGWEESAPNEVTRIQQFYTHGNLFAMTIVDHCQTYADRIDTDNYPLLHEKFWYFKDGNPDCIGPFSTVEMYKWSVNGQLPDDIEVAFNNQTWFYPVTSVLKAPNLDDPNGRFPEHLDNLDGSYEIKFVSNRQRSNFY